MDVDGPFAIGRGGGDEVPLHEGDQVLGRFPQDLHSRGMAHDELVEIGVHEGVLGGHHAYDPRPRPLGRGFDRRHDADDGHALEALPRGGERRLRGGVAGDDHRFGIKGLDESAKAVEDQGLDLRPGLGAIGEAGPVSEIHVAFAGKIAPGGLEVGEPPYPRVEDHDRTGFAIEAPQGVDGGAEQLVYAHHQLPKRESRSLRAFSEAVLASFLPGPAALKAAAVSYQPQRLRFSLSETDSSIVSAQSQCTPGL